MTQFVRDVTGRVINKNVIVFADVMPVMIPGEDGGIESTGKTQVVATLDKGYSATGMTGVVEAVTLFEGNENECKNYMGEKFQ